MRALLEVEVTALPQSLSEMLPLTFSVDGAPARRTDSRRCADRGSPHAGPLARTAEQIVVNAPGVFPLRDPFGITVVFGFTKPAYEGYSPIDPIIEVLVDVGMIEDERLAAWERELQDVGAGDKYTVTLEPESAC